MKRAYNLFESKKPQKSTVRSPKQLNLFKQPRKKSKPDPAPKRKKKKTKDFPAVDIYNFMRGKLTAQLRIHKQPKIKPDDYREEWSYYDLENIDAATYDKAKRFQAKQNYYHAYKTVQPYIVKKNIQGQPDLPNLDEYKEFTIKDFKFQGSDLTKRFRKERNKVLGQEVKVAKLVDFDFNTNRAIFITRPTFLSKAQTINPSTNTTSVDKMYTMEVEFMELEKWKDSPWKDLTLQEFRDILTACDVKLACDCPSHTFQGHRYNLTQLNSAIYPLNIPDPVWRQNHQGKGGLCKHLLGLVNDFGMMSSVILGQIKKRAKLKNIEN